MKSGKEARFLSKSVSEFISVYAPAHLTDSENTLKSYQVTLGKYLGFLEDDKGFSIQTISAECFEKQVIEEWMRHMRNIERLSPDTCNIRLGGLRTYLKYLGTREVKYKYLYSEAIDIPLMKTEKKKVVALTNDYIKTIENYLNSQDLEVRKMGAHEVVDRILEDSSRADDPALTALVNKMLQDPSSAIRAIALSMVESRSILGDDLTVDILKKMQKNNDGFGLDATQATNALLKMAGKTIEKEVPVDETKKEKAEK